MNDKKDIPEQPLPTNVNWNNIVDIPTFLTVISRKLIGMAMMTLDALGIIPIVDNAIDLGSSTKKWRKLYVGEIIGPSLVPTGSILAFGGSSAPTGFYICDGAAKSRTTEAALFAIIGTTYGTGDGSTTFNLPDLRTRVPAGYKSGDADMGTLGHQGGEKTHLLTTAELPAHNHTYTGLFGSLGGSLGGLGSPGGTTTLNTGTAGTDTAHNNLQPYLVVNYVIKA